MSVEASDVREIFEYDKGVLLWLKPNARRSIIGQPAGTAGPMRNGSTTQKIRMNETRYTRAKLVWAWHHGTWPAEILLHINGVSSDDRIENLCLRSEFLAMREAYRKGGVKNV